MTTFLSYVSPLTLEMLTREIQPPPLIPTSPLVTQTTQLAHTAAFPRGQVMTPTSLTLTPRHGSLTPDAIFVTAAGDWKLRGFELATSLLDPLAPNNESLGFFRAHASLVDVAYRAPERKRNDWEGMANNRVGASDVWALSALLERAYAGRGGAPRELGVWLKRASNPEPAKRPSCDQTLRGCPLFRGAALKELSGLQDLSATSLEDQITFYRNVEQATKRTTPDGQPCRGALDEALFRGACVHKLLPKLLATLDIALKDASEGALNMKRACVQCALPLLLVQIAAMLGDTAETDDPLANKCALSSEKRVVQGIVGALETAVVIKDPVIWFEALKTSRRLQGSCPPLVL